MFQCIGNLLCINSKYYDVQGETRDVEDPERQQREKTASSTQTVLSLHEVQEKMIKAERQAVHLTQQLHQEQQRSHQLQNMLLAESHWTVSRDEILITNEHLGRGAWGEVKVASFRGSRVAAKCFHSLIISDYNRQLFIREITMAASLRHPNLVQFIGASLEGDPVIISELMTTSLRSVLQRGPIEHAQITSISLDVARALNYLHLTKPVPMIHRDISSANVLLNPLPNNLWKAKVSDYGSVNFIQQLHTVMPGNPAYAAPEADTPANQSPKMDIFSFGILLMEMVLRKQPNTVTRDEDLARIRSTGSVFLTLVENCLKRDKELRPSAQDLVIELSAC